MIDYNIFLFCSLADRPLFVRKGARPYGFAFRKMVKQPDQCQIEDEELNNFKFDRLVKNEFPKALRRTFKRMWDNNYGPGQPWDDSAAVRKIFLAKEGVNPKVPTNKSFEEWDCTALFQATIRAKSFAVSKKTLYDLYVKPRGSPSGGFHSSVESPCGNENETFALAIDQLRLLRNSHVHSNRSAMDRKTFVKYVQRAKDAFRALGEQTDTIEAVGNSPESHLPTKEVAKLQREVRYMAVGLCGLVLFD